MPARATIDAVLRPPKRRFAAYAFGLDGTVCLGDGLLPGAREAIEALRESGARVIFVTNNSAESAADHAAKLTRLGVPTTADAIVTALDSVRLYLAERHRDSRLLLVAEPFVQTTLSAWGWTVVEDPAEAEVVIVAVDRAFDFGKLDAAFRAVVHHGASIVATNPDPFRPTPEGGLPDCAAILAAIQACTEVEPEAVLGKPSALMGSALLDRLGTPPEESALIGDRLLTDVAMAQRVGMAGVLVLSGATSPAEVIDSAVQPDYVLEGIHLLLAG